MSEFDNLTKLRILLMIQSASITDKQFDKYERKMINEIADKIIKEANGVPFIMPFTFGEYGYEEHSSNICGGLMLSFTAIGKK